MISEYMRQKKKSEMDTGKQFAIYPRYKLPQEIPKADTMFRRKLRSKL